MGIVGVLSSRRLSTLTYLLEGILKFGLLSPLKLGMLVVGSVLPH